MISQPLLILCPQMTFFLLMAKPKFGLLVGIPQVSGPYPAQYYARYEEEVRIPCPVTGATFVDWYKDGEPVTESTDIRIRSSGQFELQIQSVKQVDAGVYSCAAVNGNGPLPNWLNFTLRVLGRYMLYASYYDTKLVAGNSFS